MDASPLDGLISAERFERGVKAAALTEKAVDAAKNRDARALSPPRRPKAFDVEGRARATKRDLSHHVAFFTHVVKKTLDGVERVSLSLSLDLGSALSRS